ncbi:hypothetical protein Pmani_007683 [Petrolisthes manimaculis]|uniref:Uncharacterized protein n=1 Tax=Petrolisthes manimaculis TaxID=1843537 RepID=A0AAE1U6G2_9EUCA|nr:hypothetical protein Pmani_016358 [Petrolisthes manimaculis]KAK4319398.1 hypothetical protein Pmani_009656 [Petrolisthes manimaculis]KAK4321522.1 hypothetical protein Pmani_007683 [Petrolisthes manimaculis]
MGKVRLLFSTAAASSSTGFDGISKRQPFGHRFQSKASLVHTTTLIGEDTDILVLLLYYAQRDSKDLYYRSGKAKADGRFKVYDIKHLQEILGHDVYSQLMFIHAMTGSDTTSRVATPWEGRKGLPRVANLARCYSGLIFPLKLLKSTFSKLRNKL